MRRVVFAAYGVTGELTVSDELFERACEVLPPGWQAGDAADVGMQVELTADGDVIVDGEPVASATHAKQAIGALDAAIRARLSVLAPAHIFVHAGAVAHRGRAIVIPGKTLAGKSMLVWALVRAGAEYCSDEYAVLDAEGLVHPYPRPLSMRLRDHGPTDIPLADFGASVAPGPRAVGLIVITRYEEGAQWNPERGEPGEGALALLEHTIPVRSRPAEALAAVRRAAAPATVLKGPRGDASSAARALLNEVEATASD